MIWPLSWDWASHLTFFIVEFQKRFLQLPTTSTRQRQRKRQRQRWSLTSSPWCGCNMSYTQFCVYCLVALLCVCVSFRMCVRVCVCVRMCTVHQRLATLHLHWRGIVSHNLPSICCFSRRITCHVTNQWEPSGREGGSLRGKPGVKRLK